MQPVWSGTWLKCSKNFRSNIAQLSSVWNSGMYDFCWLLSCFQLHWCYTIWSREALGWVIFFKCRLVWCDNVRSSCRSYQIAKGKIDLTDSGNYWYQLQLMPDKFSWHGWWPDNVINILIRATRCGQWHCWMKWKVHYEGIGRRVTQVSSSNVRDLWFAPKLPVLTEFFFFNW